MLSHTPSASSKTGQDERPHILVLGGVWPSINAVTEAACMVTYQVLEGLINAGKMQVTFGLVNWIEPKLSEKGQEDIETLKQMGVRFTDFIKIDPPISFKRHPLHVLSRIITGRQDELIQGMGDPTILYEAFGGRPDAILACWSELATNLASRADIPLFTFYGNLDYKVRDANLTMRRISKGKENAFFSKFLDDLIVNTIKAGHMKIMRRYDHIFEVAANDAMTYQKAGLSAEYLANMWSIDDLDDNWAAKRDAMEVTAPLRIVVSVGLQDATGNSFAFYTLTRTILPALKRRLGEGNFELHIYGGRQPKEIWRDALKDPHIVNHGFVDDLDSEMLAAPIFLLPHNHEKFKVGHTRVLYAWSLGACVIAFGSSRGPMPELQHNVNALLGNSADEIADHVATAAADRDLRRRLAQGGLDTLHSHNNPKRLCAHLAEGIWTKLPASTPQKSG